MCLSHSESNVQSRVQVIKTNDELHSILRVHRNNLRNPTIERRWIQQGLPLYYGPPWRALEFQMEHWTWLPSTSQGIFNRRLKAFKGVTVKPTRENLTHKVRIIDLDQTTAHSLAGLLRVNGIACKIKRKVHKGKH